MDTQGPVSNFVEYNPQYRIKDGWHRAAKAIINAVKKYRLFIWQTITRDIAAPYKQSFMRVLWLFVNPVVPVFVYVLMQWVGVLKKSDTMPALAFVSIGLTYWQLFAQMLTCALNAPEKHSVFIQKAGVPLIVSYLASIGPALYEYTVRLALVYVILVALGLDFNIYWLLASLLGVPIAIIGFAIGIFASFFAIFSKDVVNGINMLLRYGVFTVGAIFPIPAKYIELSIFKLNPVFQLIAIPRDLVVLGKTSEINLYFLFTAVSLILLLWVFKKAHNIEKTLVGGF